MATLEERVLWLESDQQELRHTVGVKVEAQSFAITQIAADVSEIKTDVAEMKGRLGAIEGDVAEIKTTLATILDRLPAPPAAGG